MPVFRARRIWRPKGRPLHIFLSLPVIPLILFVGCAAEPTGEPLAVGKQQEFIRVSEDGKHFVFSGSGLKFTPWGFNYDHDRTNRLLEYYWREEWNVVVSDFLEMKALG